MTFKKIHRLFFEDEIVTFRTRFETHSSTLNRLCVNSFLSYRHRGIILTLEEFDRLFGFNTFYNVHNCPVGKELEYLISFCEYVYNLINNIEFNNAKVEDYVKFMNEHIQALCSELGYVIHRNSDDIYYIVPTNGVLDRVCEEMGDDVTQLIRVYSHKTSKGDLLKKQQILSALYKELEPYRDDLSIVEMKRIVDNVFNCANNCNIRHNNTDQASLSYRANFDRLPEEEKESIYDNMFRNIIVLLSAKIESEAINGFNDEMSKIKKR